MRRDCRGERREEGGSASQGEAVNGGGFMGSADGDQAVRSANPGRVANIA